MKEKITPHLKKLLSAESVAIQYRKQDAYSGRYSDPLNEEAHEVVKGLVHKYRGRALIKVSYQCAAHCRFCTRIRQIGDPSGTLSDEDIVSIAEYLRTHPEISDVILSGGDPLYTPSLTLRLLEQLRGIESVRVFRIGTRLPVQSPVSLRSALITSLLEEADRIAASRPFYLLLHVNAPEELTPEVLECITFLRRYRLTLLSQTVFLRGVNDEESRMEKLMQGLYHAGITPYYIYHCDAVDGLEDFAVPLEREIQIVNHLCRTLSGLACPKFVIDAAGGKGKLPVPLSFVHADLSRMTDFEGREFPVPG